MMQRNWVSDIESVSPWNPNKILSAGRTNINWKSSSTNSIRLVFTDRCRHCRRRVQWRWPPRRRPRRPWAPGAVTVHRIRRSSCTCPRRCRPPRWRRPPRNTRRTRRTRPRTPPARTDAARPPPLPPLSPPLPSPPPRRCTDSSTTSSNVVPPATAHSTRCRQKFRPPTGTPESPPRNASGRPPARPRPHKWWSLAIPETEVSYARARALCSAGFRIKLHTREF